jgi:Domain of unknown function (DUF4296)
MKSFSIITIIFCTCMFACKSKSTGEPLPLPIMKRVMWDMMKADEWYLNASLKDSSLVKKKVNTKMYDQIFALYSVTRDQFYKSYHYYEAHPMEMRTLIDSLDQFAQRERSKAFETHGQAPK